MSFVEMSPYHREPINTNAIFKLSLVLGLYPFRLEALDKIFLVYSSMIMAAVTLVGLLSMTEDLAPVLGESYNQAIAFAYLGSHTLIFPCSLICILLRQRDVLEVIRAVEEIKSVLESKMSTKRGTLLVPLLDIAVPVLCIIFYILTNRSIMMSAFGIFYGFSLLGMALVCGQYSFLIDTSGDGFTAAIDFLANPKGFSVLRSHAGRICEVVNAANRLGTVCGAINAVYSAQILIFMSICFYGLSMHLFYISMFIPYPFARSYMMLMPQVYSVLFYFYVIWRVNRSSASTSDKSREFNTILYQLMIDDQTNEILNNDKLRLHISMKREVVFNACGFFNLDYTLVHSMIASATTYLVILIQFGQPAPMTNINRNTTILYNATFLVQSTTPS